ncbi:hypothetical protein [Cohnella mopanensis]|uniref:hypothetical protein n=1 Tax=Cohnella mopanensis TaxID=2911966 RepID=UPI001EF92F70|nr:hypothetical protein [Cohnella mopanensis]
MKFKLILLMSVISLLLTEGTAISKELPTVSVFDVKQEKVTKIMPLTPELKKSVFEVLQSCPVVFGGFSMNPTNGLVVHIPFTTPVQIPHRSYSTKVSEIYLFLEHDIKPKALLFLDNHKQKIVELDYDTQKFIRLNNLSDIWLQ